MDAGGKEGPSPRGSSPESVNRPRRSQGERSEEMRARIVRAAFEVIAERGHSAFRTAAVADHAGVSQGAQVHHFATKDGLTLAAVEYAFARASARTEQIMTRGLDAGDDPIDLLIRDFRLYFMSDDFWVALDITLNGSKAPELAKNIREIVARYRLPVYTRWVEILVGAGWSREHSNEIVRMTAALVAGLGMRTLWDDVGAYLDATLGRWHAIIVATWPPSS